MTLLTILTEPAIIIISLFFLFFILYILFNYSKLEKELKPVVTFLQTLNKKNFHTDLIN